MNKYIEFKGRLLFLALLSLGVISTSVSQINWVRYNDDFTYLLSDSAKKTNLERLKYIKINRYSKVSFGGEIREQFQYYKNQNFGDVPSSFKQDEVSQIWQRIMLHSNIEMGKNLKFFGQMGSTFRFVNPNPLNPEIDQNKLNVHQAFIDYKYKDKALFRIGRQVEKPMILTPSCRL